MIPILVFKTVLLFLCVFPSSSLTRGVKRITLNRKARSIGDYSWYNSGSNCAPPNCWSSSSYGQSNDLSASSSGHVYFPSNHLSTSYYSPYGHQYPPGYSTNSQPDYPSNFGHPYQPYIGSSMSSSGSTPGLQSWPPSPPVAWPPSPPVAWPPSPPVAWPPSPPVSWPPSPPVSSAKLAAKDSEPKFVGRGQVTSLPSGSHDLTCTFGDPGYKVISNAAWVKVIGPYNYHEATPPFECDHSDCSLLYINGAQNLRFRVLTTGSVSTLRIYETQASDRGVYRCTVTGITPDGTTHTLYQIVEFVW